MVACNLVKMGARWRGKISLAGCDVLLNLVALVFIAVPWLNPIAGGPTPSVMPWLMSVACAATLCLLATQGHVRWESAIRNGWLLAALVSSFLALLQYFDASAFLNGWVNRPSHGQAFGNLRQPNQFATLVNIGLIALACLALRGRARREAQGNGDGGRLATIWMGAAAALLAVGNAASLSRTGAVQLVAILMLATMWSWWRAAAVRWILLLAALAYVVASVALPWLAGLGPLAGGIMSRFGQEAPSCGSRLVLWNNVLHLIGMKPWTGWGWGELDYAHFVTVYPGTRFCEILDNAHNLPLHLAVELGIPVALIGCGVVAWLVWRARPHKETNIERQMAWAVLALIALHSMLEYPLWYGPFQIAAALCIWILLPVPAHATMAGLLPTDPSLRGPMPLSLAPRTRLWLACIGVLTFGATAYAMWDYQRISQIYQSPEQRSPAYRDDTLAKIQGSWLYRRQVQFAELTLTRANAGNAAQIHALATQLLHFSPEPRVIEKLIDSARLLGRADEVESLSYRFKAAFPREYALWVQRLEKKALAHQPSHP